MPLLLLLLGLLIMAGAAAFVGLLIAYNSSGGPDYTVNLLGSHPFTISTLGAFAGGLALALIFGLGLWAMMAAGMLTRHRGKQRHAARHERRQLAAQRDVMANRLQETGHEERVPQGTGTAKPKGSTSYERRRPAMAFHRPHLRGH